jgi:hypothetical protein
MRNKNSGSIVGKVPLLVRYRYNGWMGTQNTDTHKQVRIVGGKKVGGVWLYWMMMMNCLLYVTSMPIKLTHSHRHEQSEYNTKEDDAQRVADDERVIFKIQSTVSFSDWWWLCALSLSLSSFVHRLWDEWRTMYDGLWRCGLLYYFVISIGVGGGG